MLASACGPRRSQSWARYRLLGATLVPVDSMMGLPLGSDGIALHPMAHTIAPGGFSSRMLGAVQFQATAQPMAQPWWLPAEARSMNWMALSRAEPSDCTLALSTSRPVAHFMCGWTC